MRDCGNTLDPGSFQMRLQSLVFGLLLVGASPTWASSQAPAPVRPELAMPADGVGECVTMPAPPGQKIPQAPDVKFIRMFQIHDFPSGTRMISVMHSDLTKMSFLTTATTHLQDPRGPSASTLTVMIDSTGAMTGQSMQSQASDASPKTAADTAAILKRAVDGMFRPDSSEKLRVRALLAWFDKRCPAP